MAGCQTTASTDTTGIGPHVGEDGPKLLGGLDGDENYLTVRVPADAAKGATRKRYCDAAGVSMGRAVTILIDRELVSRFGDVAGEAPVFAQRATECLAVREAEIAAREREIDALKETHTAEAFTPTHHALMMAWVSRAVVDAVCEEEGERIVRNAVVKYGNQRGRRMAMRATANGHPLTFPTWLAYAGTELGRGEMDVEILEKSPHARVHVCECPWYGAWGEDDLMRYGRYYCMEIDKAVLQRFNQDLALEVNGTHGRLDLPCRFGEGRPVEGT